MKHLFIILLLLGSTSLLYSMQNQNENPDVMFEVDGLSAERSSQSDYEKSKIMYKTKTGWDTLPIFKNDNIVREDVDGLTINSDGSWSQTEMINDSLKKLRLALAEQKEERKKLSLETANKIYNNRLKQNLVSSPGVIKSSDNTLFNNFLQGVSYYNDNNDRPTPYGQYFSIWFNRNECEIETNTMGVVGMLYKKMPNEVVILSRFRQIAYRIPYPFAKHIFKVKGGVAIPGCSNKSDIEFMSVPLIKPCSNISDEVLLEKLKEKRFVGYTRNSDIKVTLKDQSEIEPFLYTVVEFHKEGYMSICYPALKKVYIPDGNYTVKGSIIVVGGENIGFVKNNGDALTLARPFSDNVYKLSENFSSKTNTKETSSKQTQGVKKASRNTNRTTIKQKSTNKSIKTDKIR